MDTFWIPKYLQKSVNNVICGATMLNIGAALLLYYDAGMDDGERRATAILNKALEDGEFVIGPMFEYNNPWADKEYVACLKQLKANSELKAAMLDKDTSVEECMVKARLLMDTDKAVELVRRKLKEEAETTEETETTENKEETV